MKRLFIISLLASSFVLSAQTGVSFEYKMSSSEMPDIGSMKGYFSDGNSRSEVSVSIPGMEGIGKMSNVGLMTKKDPQTMYLLNEKAKTYTVLKMDQLKSREEDYSNAKVTLIGKEKVNKYNATHVVIENDGKKIDWWTTTDISNWNLYQGVRSRYTGNESLYKKLSASGAAGFPCKMQMKEGNSVVTLELVKAESKTISASMFEVPSDYKQLTIPAAVGGPQIDYSRIKDMTPEQQKKFMEDAMRKYQESIKQNH